MLSKLEKKSVVGGKIALLRQDPLHYVEVHFFHHIL